MTAIFWDELKSSLRSWRILSIGILSMLIVITSIVSGFILLLYLFLFEPSGAIPFPISVTYYLLFLLIPIIAHIIGHDMVSGDIERNHIRGVISKVSRRSFILQKFFALYSLIVLLNLFLLMFASIYSMIKFAKPAIPETVIFFLYLAIYGAAVCSMTMFFSVIHSKSSSSLLTGILVFSGLVYASRLVVKYTSIKYPLVLFSHIKGFDTFLIPALIFLGYLVVFLYISVKVFNARDL